MIQLRTSEHSSHLEKTSPFPCSASRLDGIHVANLTDKADLLEITGFYPGNSDHLSKLPRNQLNLAVPYPVIPE